MRIQIVSNSKWSAKWLFIGKMTGYSIWIPVIIYSHWLDVHIPTQIQSSKICILWDGKQNVKLVVLDWRIEKAIDTVFFFSFIFRFFAERVFLFFDCRIFAFWLQMWFLATDIQWTNVDNSERDKEGQNEMCAIMGRAWQQQIIFTIKTFCRMHEEQIAWNLRKPLTTADDDKMWR